MTLIFDLTRTQPFGDIKIHGGGKYGEIVFKALIKQSTNLVAYYNSSAWLNPEILALCESRSIPMIDSNDKTLAELAYQYKSAIYSPIVDISLLKKEKKLPCIATVHGLRVLEMPNDALASYYKDYGPLGHLYKAYTYIKSRWEYRVALSEYREIFQNENFHSIAVSEHSKSSILAFIPRLKPECISVFYSPSTTADRKEVAPYESEKYYLIVGANRWIKNALRALKALDEIFTERPNFKGKVIVTGVKDRHLFDKHISNKTRFEFIDYATESLLYSLYKGAYLFIYPSLNEGFGYPPLEAMSQRTPVIASAISSIPEICGDCVLYFNPNMISEIKMRIIQMEDESLRQFYASRGHRRFMEIKGKQDEDLGKLANYLLAISAKTSDSFFKNP